MVLHHVAQRAGGVVVAGPGADAERFGDGDLDTLDALAVPRRLDQPVAEPEDEQVLNRFFPEIVIDAIDLELVKVLMHQLVERLRATKSLPKGFSTISRVQPRRLRPASPSPDTVAGKPRGGIDI